jgi:RNA polymerase II elongation factor ELL
MPVLSIPESGLSLGTMHGAANPSDDLPEAFGIVLSESVIEDMIKCIRNGRTIQLSMGDDPVSTKPTEIIHFP